MIDAKLEHSLAVEASPWNEHAERTYAFTMGWMARANLTIERTRQTDQRGLFEKAFPVAYNVQWNPLEQQYEWNKANNSLTEAMEQNRRWVVWQAAVAANMGVSDGKEEAAGN